MLKLICCRRHDSLSIHVAAKSPYIKCTFRARVIRAQKHSHIKGWFSDSNRFPVLAAHSSNGSHQPDSPTLKKFEGYGLHDDNKPNAKKGDKESIMVKLRRYGVAGMLSYGLLNTIYYLGMFLFAWFYISPVPSGLGYRSAAERFIKLFALVWAGSQVTKLLRAGCALAIAPIIDKGLTWMTVNSRFKSRAEVFGMIVASCFGLAIFVFLVITFLWA